MRKLICTVVESSVEVVEKEKRLEKVTAFQAEIARKQKEEEEKMEVVDEVMESRKEPAKARKMDFISMEIEKQDGTRGWMWWTMRRKRG